MEGGNIRSKLKELSTKGKLIPIHDHGLLDPQDMLHIPLNPSQWEYKNEGGQHVILAFRGEITENTEILRGKVLRLKKDTGKKHHGIIRGLHFEKNVMSKLLGESFVQQGLLVHVDKEFLSKLNDLLTPCRPILRVDHSLDLDMTFGVLLPDLTRLEDVIHVPFQEKVHFTVEIKPKWGGMPTSPYIKKQNAVKYTTCRYCMHQHLKLHKKGIESISNYCPVDFFSGEPGRIESALRSLFVNPQNNLKVFCNGQLCYADRTLGEEWSHLTVEYLDQQLQKWPGIGKESKPLDLLVKALVQIFVKEPVLFNLKGIQQADVLDIEGVYYLFKMLQKIEGAVDEAKEHELENKEELERLFTSAEQISATIDEFLVAATAKDCSIMVTLAPIEKKDESDYVGFPVLELEEIKLMYRLSVVDLDPKSHANLEEYYKLDQEIARVYSNMLQTPKVCHQQFV